MFNRPEVIKPGSPMAAPDDDHSRARARPRHYAVMISFVVFVLLPFVAATAYMWVFARDRYISRAEFSIRTNEVESALQMLGGLAQLSGGSSSSDAEVLYNYIQSQDMVGKVRDRLDLHAIWGPKPEFRDPVFTYDGSGNIEGLLDYWHRMVRVSQSNDGILKVQVQAFDPKDAQIIAQLIFDESQQIINELSAIAREDSTRYAREEMEEASEQLKQARIAVNRFRNTTQIIDPAAAIQSQMGLMNSLQQQLATILVERGILQQTAPEQDPRMQQINRRVEVIQSQIELERNKLGQSQGDDKGDEPFADLLGRFEELQVEQGFAERRYITALASYDAALAESRRKTRYLGAYVSPTLAQSPELPNRALNAFFVLLLSFIAWSITVLTIYAIRERR